MGEVNALTIGSWWRCRVRADDGRITKLVTVGSRKYPNGDTVTLDEPIAEAQIGGDTAIAAVFGEDGQVSHFEPQSHLIPKAPPLWFVEVPETTEQPPATNLMAFTGHGQAEGALVHHTDFADLDVPNDAQVGAIRWEPSTGRVDQLYVQPHWRRCGISSALVAVGGVLGAAREWPPMWGDGQRTELGEAMKQGVSWNAGMAELTHLHPPMTPEPERRVIAPRCEEATLVPCCAERTPRKSAAVCHGGRPCREG